MRVAIACLGLLAGCAAEAQDDVQAVCSPRKGSYVITMIEKSGSCGPLGDQIVQVDTTKPAAPNPNCTGSWTPSADSCKTTGSTTCTNPMSGVKITERGSCTWSKDGSGGTCEVQIIFTGGGLDCSSLYEERFRRQ
jgi:hypothetical protein